MDALISSLVQGSNLELRTFYYGENSVLVEIDIIAMATVIILVKMLFGLDGRKEV